MGKTIFDEPWGETRIGGGVHPQEHAGALGNDESDEGLCSFSIFCHDRAYYLTAPEGAQGCKALEDALLPDFDKTRSRDKRCKERGAVRTERLRIKHRKLPWNDGTWGPHADVPAGLAKVANEIPLVILSNAMDSQIMSNVAKLGAPFHAVYTAEQAQAYKPHFKAFEYLFDMLGCGPEDILHVSSSFRYDLMSAHDLGIKNKVWVNRGHEPANPYYGYVEIADISGLAGVVGL